MNIAAAWPRPREILEYYQQSREAIAILKKSLATAVGRESLFFGRTDTEIELTMQRLAKELDDENVLLLTASFEAELQVDLYDRLSRRKRDQISRRFRNLASEQRRKRAKWIPIEEILKVWKQEIGKKRVIGLVQQLIGYRHWLAHGRYWVQRSGLRSTNPFDTWERGKALFDVLPGFPPLAQIV